MNMFNFRPMVSGRIHHIRRAILRGLMRHPDGLEVLLVLLEGHRGCFIFPLSDKPPKWLKIPDDGKAFVSPLPYFSVDLAIHEGFIVAMRKTKKTTA